MDPKLKRYPSFLPMVKTAKPESVKMNIEHSYY